MNTILVKLEDDIIKNIMNFLNSFNQIRSSVLLLPVFTKTDIKHINDIVMIFIQGITK